MFAQGHMAHFPEGLDDEEDYFYNAQKMLNTLSYENKIFNDQ